MTNALASTISIDGPLRNAMYLDGSPIHLEAKLKVERQTPSRKKWLWYAFVAGDSMAYLQWHQGRFTLWQRPERIPECKWHQEEEWTFELNEGNTSLPGRSQVQKGNLGAVPMLKIGKQIFQGIGLFRRIKGTEEYLTTYRPAKEASLNRQPAKAKKSPPPAKAKKSGAARSGRTTPKAPGGSPSSRRAAVDGGTAKPEPVLLMALDWLLITGILVMVAATHHVRPFAFTTWWWIFGVSAMVLLLWDGLLWPRRFATCVGTAFGLYFMMSVVRMEMEFGEQENALMAAIGIISAIPLFLTDRETIFKIRNSLVTTLFFGALSPVAVALVISIGDEDFSWFSDISSFFYYCSFGFPVLFVFFLFVPVFDNLKEKYLG